MKSIFERIIDKELPSKIIHEDDDFIVILDSFAKSQGHSLIIPKKKKENVLSEEDLLISKMFILAKKISNLLMEKLHSDGIKWLVNSGSSAGQEIFHTHLHLIPFYSKENDAKNDYDTFSKIVN